MKRIMFVASALLLGLAFWIIKVGWAQKSNSDDADKCQQKNWFEINTSGTLKVVRDKKGREIFGPGRPPNEGYSITYRRLDPTTKKPMEDPRTFFAVGNQFSEEQLICEECEKYKKRLRDQAIATVTTKDGVLRINSNFYFFEKDGKLKIVRIIENISNYPVQLISIRAQYDARLSSNKATQFGKVKSDRPHKIAQSQPKFAPSNTFVSGSWTPAAPLFHPSCEPCPPYCDLTLTAGEGEKELICVECPEDGSSVLEYMAINVPKGQDPKAIIDRRKPKGGCEHSIVVDVWDGGVKVDDIDLGKLGIGEVICVDCPKTGGETFIVQPVSILGNAIDSIKNLRDSGRCQLAIHVDNGGFGSANPKMVKASDGQKMVMANDGQIGPGEEQAVVQILTTQK